MFIGAKVLIFSTLLEEPPSFLLKISWTPTLLFFILPYLVTTNWEEYCFEGRFEDSYSEITRTKDFLSGR